MPDQRDLGQILLKRGYNGIKKIGEGSFGVAVLVEDQDGTKAVCKLVDVSKASPKETQEARREGRLLAQVKHPYIVRYRENFAERGWLCIIMDFCDGGDLTAQIEGAAKNRSRLEEQQVLRWFTQCMLALKYLHSKHILHRDLKPSNLFLTKAGDVRMGDFGISKVMTCTGAYAKTFVGTPYYLSPEVIQEKPYSWPADIWSMGCILYQLCALRVPFDAANITGLAQKICGGRLPTVPEGYSDAVRQLSADMMARKATARPSTDDIIDRPLIQGVVRAMLNEARKPEKPRVKHEIMDQFHKFDQNGDGVIDRKELSIVLKHLDAGVWTDDNIDRVLHVADKNGDGRIQFDEFLLWAFGGGEEVGMAERAKAIIARAHKAVEDADVTLLGETLLEWRQAVDVGCLRVSPPDVCVKTCEALSWIALGARGLLEAQQEVQASYEAAKQMRAILLAVEQLLEECSRQHVQGVAHVSSRAALRGVCFELADGTRLGTWPEGLSDRGLNDAGGRWEMLAEGERILEVKGFAVAPQRSAAQRRPSPEPLVRRGSPPPRASPEPAKPQAERGLVASLTLCTSHGRELELGARTGRGDAFSFKAPEGEEVQDLKFDDKSCQGVRTAPIRVSWPRDKVEEVRAAFCVAAEAVWPTLLCLSWRMGPRHGKYALLEARRLGLSEGAVPDDVQAEQEVHRATTHPSHWDLSIMGGGLGPDVEVGQVPLGEAELARLQGLLNVSYRTRGAAREAGTAVAPDGIELMRGSRLQSWQSWNRFAARQEAIRAELSDLKNAGQLAAVSVANPIMSAHLDTLGISLDSETRCTWLFHGIRPQAVEDVVQPDFDISKAGSEDGRLYGRGVYLSEWCSQVDKLLRPDGNSGLRCMLLCRVALGNVLLDTAILPDVVHLVSQCTSGQYHCVLGDREERCPGSTRDFVVYDKDQVYPEFLLWYRRVYH
mmetsp:Transcript_5374/g.16609  ORF Transcript_5374/g.16609 Transcript_5374/m.16609 type:complete len:945 (+) Transcript_5374:136-2970(+)